MTQHTEDTTTIRRSVTVEAPQAKAFYVFTTEMGSWWPLLTHHIAKTEAVEVVLEPHAPGRWYEVDAEGRECEWGTVLEYEPSERVVLGWHLGPDFAYDPDPAKATEVEVRFTAESDSRTRVELEHRGFEVHGADAQKMIGPISSDGGWGTLLRRFADFVSPAD